jgi:hypothetical protein
MKNLKNKLVFFGFIAVLTVSGIMKATAAECINTGSPVGHCIISDGAQKCDRNSASGDACSGMYTAS